MSFADGLSITVKWYKQFGEQWWGNISKVLSPFPIVDGDKVMSDKEPITDSPQPTEGQSPSKKRKVDGVNGHGTNGVNGAASSFAIPATL